MIDLGELDRVLDELAHVRSQVEDSVEDLEWSLRSAQDDMLRVRWLEWLAEGGVRSGDDASTSEDIR